LNWIPNYDLLITTPTQYRDTTMTLITLTRAPTSTLSTSLEALAVRLENRDEGAWKTLLSQVNPVFGDPIAAQVAHLMKTYKVDGEYDGQLIRKMLSEKADLATALPSEARLLCRPEDDVAEEAFEVEVDEVQWRGRTYLVADDGTLFDDVYYRVGTWTDHAVAGSAPVWSVAEETDISDDDSDWPSESEDEEDHAEENTARTSLGCDMCEPYAPGQMYACDDCWIPCPGCSGGYEDDEYEMAQPRFLNGLSKERLVELILMTEEQRDDALYKGTMAMVEAE